MRPNSIFTNLSQTEDAGESGGPIVSLETRIIGALIRRFGGEVSLTAAELAAIANVRRYPAALPDGVTLASDPQFPTRIPAAERFERYPRRGFGRIECRAGGVETG